MAVSISIGLIAAELLIRLLAPQPLSIPMFDHVDAIAANRPNISGRASIPGLFSVIYHSNSQRFRGTADYPAAPVDGVFRIATLGDSFCWGIGAEDDQTYPAVLQRALNASGRRTEVINAGVAGTGTGMQSLWYERGVQPLHPGLVILCVYANDADDDRASPAFVLDSRGGAQPVPFDERMKALQPTLAARRKVQRIPFYEFLSQQSHLLNMIRSVGSKMMSGKSPVESAADQEAWYRDKGLPLMKAEIRWLRDCVASAQGKLVVVFFPPRASIYPDNRPASEGLAWKAQTLRAALAQFCPESGIPYWDGTEALQSAAKSRPDELYYRRQDEHPRPEGYRIFAEELARFLTEHGLVPAM